MRLTSALLAAGIALAPIPAAAQAQGALFVANKTEDSVSRIRLADGREEKRQPVCNAPHELALSPDGAHVVVACYAGSALQILRSDDLEKIAELAFGHDAKPHGVIWHENGNIYATLEQRQAILVMRDPLSGEPANTQIPSEAQGTHMIAVSPDARHAWSTDMQSGSVTRYDLVKERKARAVQLGKEPEGLALSPDGKTLWVALRGEDRLLALDPQTLAVRRSIATGRFPIRVAVSPDGAHVVTSNLRDGALTVLDTREGGETREIRVSSSEETGQVTLLFGDDPNLLYVAETQLSKIAEVDLETGEVLGRLAGGVGGDGLAIAPAGGE